ncbi:MAG: dockerin type I domain-containing protein [Candidatus Poribacteria bacterium]|nr:dockerin type I domain-containing protein [Candidatus Poribacteria bacterium]
MDFLTVRFFRFALIVVILFGVVISQGNAFNYHWEIDETPEGSESATIVEPVEVTLLDEQIQVPSHSASLALMRKYSVHLGPEWDPGYAYRLLQTFESIPQETNNLYANTLGVAPSIWRLSDRHIQDDISVEYRDGQRIATIAESAFVHAEPLLAEIEGVRGRYFSKRLHHAVVRFVTDDGVDRYALERILQERYAVSINVPDYTELTRHTTGEHAGRFSEFKNEELIALVSMLEEFPSGMLKTPGLKYLVRRLDGTPHPLYPSAPAVAWPQSGYIEFMESAFKGQGLDYIHRLILHEKAHFLWEYLFDDQLKQDWIELGGWYENPDDKDGWSTTKQTEFVSAYAHGKNPNEDMAESISYYIVNPDKLRSRSPTKYEFIQSRVMHGTRYISKIREDLTFEVYNLYPDYVYPGRIIRVDIQVEGEPEEDKLITVEIEIHRESDFDTALGLYFRVASKKGTYFDIGLDPIDSHGNRISLSHIFRGSVQVSKYAANGYWAPDSINLKDANTNERHQSAQTDFGWKLYINNPLADCDPPEYVKDSMQIFLSQGEENGRTYHLITARWKVVEKNGIGHVYTEMNDDNPETYVSAWNYGEYNPQTGQASVELIVPDYYQSGTYSVNFLSMRDVAGNYRNVFFTNTDHSLGSTVDIRLDEPPATIDIQTKNPDSTPPVLDLNQITIKAEPTNPEAPNGETRVDITFRIKDDISGYKQGDLRLRDPQGTIHAFYHSDEDIWKVYFSRDPTVYRTYHKAILLPIGSVPGTWGLTEMVLFDKAGNRLQADFTETVRFEVNDASIYAESDVNQDGTVNIQDLVMVANAIGHLGTTDGELNADINADGVVDILDLVQVANDIGEESAAAPAIHNLTTEQIQSWLTQVRQIDDESPDFRRTISVLETLLRALLPETTVLLPNYPNPFNPETWIPYQLANASDVQITIYGMKGIVVRTLALGHQAAGYYTDKNRAAYWDGRNSLGENVASGVYFYQLQAGEISPMRKMVILK